jgi:S-DNA-T family DNA segregation ATPase FtsK/SpoIIIE
LVKWIGTFGTGAILVTAVFSYFIWRFNPTFKWPEFKRKEKEIIPIDEEEEEEPLFPTNKVSFEEEIPFIIENIEPATDEPAIPISQNKLKEGAGISVIMPKEEPSEANPLIDFTINEPVIEEGGKLFIDNSQLPKGSLSLEIKQAVEEDIDVEEDEIEIEEDEIEKIEEEEYEPPFVLNKPVVSRQTVETNYDATLDLKDYKYPTLDLLETHGSEKITHDPAELEAHKNQIVSTLMNYDIAIQRIAATVGPTVTLYEIVPAPGVRISRIKNLEDDIALSLAALGIRIIAPIPGKGTIGIEVPNIKKTVVSMKTLLMSDKYVNSNFSLPIAIGKKIDNENFIVDLATMPHLLMAGATGQGKSVGINTLLVSLLYKKHPSQLKFVLVDPKKVELSLYRVIEKHFLAKLPGEEESIITDTKKVVSTLNALCIEMDNRYDLLKEAGCRNIKEYNEKFTNRRLNPQKGHQYLPFIVLVVDEFADLIMTAGKEVEMPIARLAQLARAIGIHLIIATQRPSVNIITGTIKANFPARVAFKVSSKIDSRTILDAGGAEQLIGKGDMLISYNGEITRVQCAFVDTPEVERVCEFIGNQRGYPEAFLLPEYVDEKDMDSKDFDNGDKDPLFEEAARLIVQNQMGSTSLIQRRMKLGYNRAGRLMDQLERAGVVGPNLGSKAREVYFKTDVELQDYLDNLPN